jgi:hypothetical protein
MADLPPVSTPTEKAPSPRTSPWATASILCGILGCLGITAILAVIFGLLGLRQVNRSDGQFKGRGTAIAGLVLGAIFVLVTIFVSLPVVNGIFVAQRKMACTFRLHHLSAVFMMYTSNNNGHYPTVYSDPPVAGERWGPGFDPATGAIADYGAKTMTRAEHGPFTCNLSSLWASLDPGYAMGFTCPGDSGATEYAYEKPTGWWSFSNIKQCSYSYQNQLGRNTYHADKRLIILADRNPQRPGVVLPNHTKPAWAWNSPNHNFEGQNCLFTDGSIEFLTSPEAGPGGDNIWLRSTWDADGRVVEDTHSYEDGTSQTGDPRDSFLVP